MASKQPIAKESEEDLLLKQELLSLVEKLKGKNEAVYLPALESLQNLLKTPAASMTSIPKPRKYLVEYYSDLKECHKKLKDKAKKLCADIISVVSLAVLDQDVKTNRECLNYCLMGNMQNMADLGHEYFRQLEEEIIDEYVVNSSRYAELQPLIHKIIDFDCKNHDEIQACDLLMEVDKIDLLADHITPDMYDRICLYLTSCSPYVDETELSTLLNFVFTQYYKYNEYIKCLMVAMKLQNDELIKKVIDSCSDPLILKQMAYIAGRQQVVLNFKDDLEDKEDLENITCNGHLNKLFFSFTTELDIREPKSPEEIFKNWDVSYPRREVVDSSKQNLASTFVNAFVNAGFGTDKLLTGNDANFWIFRHKEHAMLSATASLGLIHLWDVDGGLTPIDKFLYSEDPYIKAGALLGIGIVNCRVRNECDPAFALLSDYVGNPNSYLQLGAIFGLGLAYAGTQREDVLKLLLEVMFKDDISVEVLSVACISCGLIAVSSCNAAVTNAIMQILIENNAARIFQNPYGKLLVLGLGLCYMGRKDAIEAPVSALEVLGEPVRSTAQTILQMCGYAGTGDVLVIQELLHACGEQGDDFIQPPKPKTDPKEKESKGKESSSNNTSKKQPTVKPSVMFSAMRALAGLGIAVVALGEDIGKEMCPKICTHMGRYGDVVTRKVVPLAVALCSISNPQISIVNILHKYSHDGDNEVACNAIFALGLVGAGSNNARLTTMFRQLAEYHRRNPSQLFMVRVASGLNKLGKGTLTLNPLHTDKQLFSTTALAGLLITIFAMIDNATVLFSKGHYFLYALTTAIQPRWLITVDENMEKICVPVRIGQAVDVVGKAGIPKAISGFHTQTTPVLLALGERAELATDQYEPLSPYMEGVVVLKKKQEL